MEKEKHIICIEQPEIRKKLISRINRIDGQVKGIERMILSHVKCDDILNQIASVKSALNGVAKVVLEVHLRNCVVNDIQDGNEEESISILVNILNNFIYKNSRLVKDSNEDIVKKIEKQIMGIRTTLHSNECCTSILKTIATIKSELNDMSKVILERHMRNCFVEEIKNSIDDTDNVVNNFLYTINKMMK